MELDVDGFVEVPALAGEDLVVECTYVIEFLLGVVERTDEDGVVTDSWDEFGITVFANIDLCDFGRPEVVAFEEESEVVEGLDVTCLDKASDERQLDGSAKLGRHHGAIAIDVEIGHGVSVIGIDKYRALDTNDGIALFDVDAQKTIGRVVARSMAHQAVLFLDVLGKFKSIDLGVWLALEAESRLAFDELANTGLGDEVGIVARIVDGNEHATIAGFVAPEAIEVAGSQQVA